MCAAAMGHIDALRTLVAANADAHTLKDKTGRSAAQLATSRVVQAVLNVRCAPPPPLTRSALSARRRARSALLCFQYYYPENAC